MEQELIDKLKVKPTPKNIKTVEILLNRPQVKDREDVFLKTNVVDKTGINQIDRQEFLNKIQQNVATRLSVKKETDGQTDREIATTRKSISKSNIKDTDIILIINISKTGRKLTIKKENADVEIDIVLDKTIYQQDRKTQRPEDRTIEGPQSLLEMKNAEMFI